MLNPYEEQLASDMALNLAGACIARVGELSERGLSFIAAKAQAVQEARPSLKHMPNGTAVAFFAIMDEVHVFDMEWEDRVRFLDRDFDMIARAGCCWDHPINRWLHRLTGWLL